MSPIKDLTLFYEALNEEDTFSDGDTILGTVSFILTKETKVKSLFVKTKGEARVNWSEGSGDSKKSYSAYRRFFKVKEYIVAENSEGSTLPQGLHQFNFTLTIPPGDLPSSFKGIHGKIVYTLEAKVSRSWRWPSVVQRELNFLSKSVFQYNPVMVPHSGSVDKELGVFSKGQVQMSATVNKSVCSPGDTLFVAAKICNSSSKKMKPKFSLLQRTVYRAGNATNVNDLNLCKIVGETITTTSEEAVSCQLTVPDDAIYTLSNCEILSVEYFVKVYLDISFAIDPEVMFPLTIVPRHCSFLHPDEAMGPYPAGAAGAPSYSDFPVPAGPYPMPTGPAANGYPEPDPTQQGSAAYGFNGYQQTAPYAVPNAAFPPPLQQPQQPPPPPQPQQPQDDPAAPPRVQVGPPDYVSLYPATPDFLGSSG